MSVQTISATVKDAGTKIFDGGKSAATWGAHKVGSVAGFLKDKAAVIMSFITTFFKNIPHYLSLVGSNAKSFVQYLGNNQFVQHIKNNKANSAGIAGIAVAITTIIAMTVFKHSKEM